MPKKKANAIVHSVYMGDGVRLYYEKIDLSLYKGEEASFMRDLADIIWKVMKLWAVRKWAHVVDTITQREPEWPPHNLLCGCRKCNKMYSNYTKSLKG